MHTYKRFEGESDDALIFRITGEKDKIGSWQDVADVLNELLGTNYNSSTFRKNLASNLSYLYLFSWCLIGVATVIATYNYKPLFYLMLIMLFQSIQLIIQKIINK